MGSFDFEVADDELLVVRVCSFDSGQLSLSRLPMNMFDYRLQYNFRSRLRSYLGTCKDITLFTVFT
jgi:hypothetical protein